MNLLNDLMAAVEESNVEALGNRSLIKSLVKHAKDQERLEECLEDAYETLASTDFEVMPLTFIVRHLADNMAKTLGVKLQGAKASIMAGACIYDWFAKIGMVTIEKREQIKESNDGSLHMDQVWFGVPKTILLQPKDAERPIFCDPRKPFEPWTANVRHDSGKPIPIVKKADRYGLMGHYTPDQIPLVYTALNRVSSLTWRINQKLLDYCSAIDSSNSPLPDKPSTNQCFMATKTYADLKASRKKRDSARQVLRAKGQVKQFDEVLRLGIEYQGNDLHFVYNCGSNGRMYCLSPTLTPQGSDMAKALLWTKHESPIDVNNFYWHLANCAGQDKLEHDDRVKWVEANYDSLITIGRDPIASWPLIKELGIDKEKKTFFQFISCCMELDRLNTYVLLGGNILEFTTGILLGMDSTSSGNQILAMLAGDHEVAWEVNIAGGDGRGDLYGKIGKSVHQVIRDFTLGDAEDYLKKHLRPEFFEALGKLPDGHKIFRDITKRPCMVLPYSGTRRGAADIMVDDQADFKIAEIRDLNWAEARQLGYIIHDECRKAAKRSMDIMDFLVDGVKNVRSYVEDDGKVVDVGTPCLVTWRIPITNFLCFQHKEEGDPNRRAVVEIDNITAALKFYEPKLHKLYPKVKKGSLSRHKNAIAPGVVHSLDATLMMLIVVGVPEGMPVTAIHDQFCVPLRDRETLVAVARSAYKAVGCRDHFKQLCDNAFGQRPLPAKGNWEEHQLDDSEYFVS